MIRQADAEGRKLDIFFDALKISDPAQRKVMLDLACAGNLRLCEELEEMLALQTEADRFFSDCAAAMVISKGDLEDASARLEQN